MRTITMSHKLKVIIQFDNIQLCKTQEVCLATPGRITKLKMLSHETHLFSPYLPLLKIGKQDNFWQHYQTVRQWIVGKFLVQSCFVFYMVLITIHPNPDQKCISLSVPIHF